ncbi:MAG: LysR family transcriptional regulator [Sandaracinaceae bacterium]|nr:LysR family transcriptional regulator [Sandaracinaceae bacterium]
MSNPDLNLLLALDVLLEEESVAAASRRLRLSPSAMSRTLARLRQATGDPLLVRAGRSLVPTPRALELRGRVSPVVQEAVGLLRPAASIRLEAIESTFTLRCAEGFVETFGAAITARLVQDAPRVRLRFVPKVGPDTEPLRVGSVDLDTGVVSGVTGPEVRTSKLFTDRFVGVVREGHPLGEARVTLARYANAKHVEVARHVAAGRASPGPIDGPLRERGRERDVPVIVGGFASAIALARASDLVATVPERHTESLRAGMRTFALPFATPPIPIALMWHPRLDADPAHRWLRGCVREVCATRA